MGGYFVKKKTKQNKTKQKKNAKLNKTMRVKHEAYLMHEALK